MIGFIKLTRWYTYRYQYDFHGQPVWINPEKILSMIQLTKAVFHTVEDTKIPTKDRQTELYTLIALTSGGEDPETWEVQETPDQIERLVGYANENDIRWRQDIGRDRR